MKNKKLLDHIRRSVELTPEEESLFSSKLVYRKYLKNQYIVQEGDTCKAACFILSGCAKTFFMDKDGQEHIIVLAIEDWWTSDLESFLYQIPANYSTQCLEDTEVLQLIDE